MLDTINISDRNYNGVDHGGKNETEELLKMPIIVAANAFANKNAMMIKPLDTHITNITMPGILPDIDLADRAKPIIADISNGMIPGKPGVREGQTQIPEQDVQAQYAANVGMVPEHEYLGDHEGGHDDGDDVGGAEDVGLRVCVVPARQGVDSALVGWQVEDRGLLLLRWHYLHLFVRQYCIMNGL